MYKEKKSILRENLENTEARNLHFTTFSIYWVIFSILFSILLYNFPIKVYSNISGKHISNIALNFKNNPG